MLDPSHDLDSLAARVLIYESAKEVAARLAHDLAPMQVLVFKGLHLASMSSNPLQRPLNDVDAIVIGRSMSRVLAKLRGIDHWQIMRDDDDSIVIGFEKNPVMIDLHRCVLPLGLGEFAMSSIAAHRTRAPDSLDARLWVPSNVQAGCIAVSNAAKSLVERPSNSNLEWDLGILAAGGLTPSELARALVFAHLRKWALVAFAAHEPALIEWRDALRPSEKELANARKMADFARTTNDTRRAWWTMRALGDTPFDQVRSVAGQTFRRATRHWKRNVAHWAARSATPHETPSIR